MTFKNFIDWVSPTTEDGRNLNQPTNDLMPHVAQMGDFWRLLIHKSHLRGNGPEEVTATLVKQVLTCTGLWNQTWAETEYDAVTCRRQLCEKYTEFTVQVNGISTNAAPRQFALVRANGTTLLPTVTATGATVEAYAEAIKAAWEGYNYAPVFVQRNGSLLRVRIFHNTNFLFRDEDVSIGLGAQAAINTNTPILTINNIGSTAYPARKSWELHIDDVEEGNIFTLGTSQYVVKSGDTADTVKAAFLGEATRYIVPATDITALNAEKGSKQVANKNRPSILLTYVNTVSSKDRYTVTIGDDVLAGNVYEITAPSTTPKKAIATGTDTPASIAGQLVAVSGYYEVNTGITPTEKVILGTLTVPNSNSPEIDLRDLISIASVTLQKYLIVIDGDIVPGNEFTYEGQKHVAVLGDTPDTVAVALGLPANNSVIEAEESPAGFAAPGQLTHELAAVRLVQNPIVRRSNQFIVEVAFQGVPAGVYNIKLDCFTHVLYSNNITVAANVPGTKMLEVADRGEVFGYDYAEPGLTQRIRLDLHTHFAKNRTMENRSKLLSGAYKRTTTAIERTRQLITPAQGEDYHFALSAWLKHSEVWIDGESFFVEGEYSEQNVPNWQKTWNATATLVENNDRDNKGRYVLTSSLPTGYGRAILTGFHYGLEIILKSNEIQVLIKGNEGALPAGEYELIIWNDGDKRKVKAGIEAFLGDDAVRVPSRSVTRWRRWIRIEPGLTTTIFCERLTDTALIDYSAAPADSEVEITSFETEYGITHDYNADYNDDHNT